VRRVGTRQQSVATTRGVPITLALVVAAPLCWGVIAAKPPHIALLQLSGAHPDQDQGGRMMCPRMTVIIRTTNAKENPALRKPANR